MGIADLRREYNLTGLRRADLEPDAIAQFNRWFEQARGARASATLRKFFIRVYKALFMGGSGPPSDVNAMTLATVDSEGRPFGRTVLLKGVDARGFIFFTNYESRKGRQLAGNSKAALVFYWPDLERQVCVSGDVTKVPASESEAYFKSRPRGSRLGAWASRQSEAVPDRAALEKQWHEMETKYPGEDIPCPPFWGGYVLHPIRIEFWQGRANRLHDRFCYTRQADNTWKLDRLSP